MDFDTKVKQLLDKFHNARPDFQSQIGEWRVEHRKAVITANLYEHPVIKEFVSHLFDEVEGINYRLQNEYSAKLTQEERDRLLDKKSLYEEFVFIFIAANKKVETIENAINENLK